ncbi:flagellar filament capping protein FliD [Paenibacillus larvae]|uniref:Flagellar hook-associated protein 2 n=3 Tax=Paenibacillus larvae TaxID=1464 RepID=V9W4C2_9BACL|nr:flagellar filament capping protein FliD [Paenibacillus larvae]AHD03992.1 flagellar hook-associated protein [Paenibacillus larvae subsp. larvae DSM 25430]AQR78615.1 hypothetical protein BXP28_16375 [Paenibacillus larvae subsp. larvae]AVF20130.1 flagellar hook-associated protein [Paenibacillus larvae subsp. larvae]AVG10597.1 flagellar hook-associated protein [Paenibacillus larvae subsp. larvae DSM 25430]ETK29219.1 flagellar hook-associated protein [Paenibacillus larvae subsp. larvae DSM 25719
MRINGFSGMDIDSMIANLMKAHRQPINRMNQKKTLYEWQQNSYREVNSKLVDFRNNKLLSKYTSSSFNTLKAAVSGNASAITAKATSKAATGTITIDVESLASSSRVKGKNSQLAGRGDEKLADLEAAGVLKLDGETSIKINGVSIDFDPNTDTLNTIVQKINGNKEAGVTAFYNPDNGQISLTSKTTGTKEISLGGSLLTGTDNLNLNEKIQGTDAKVVINGVEATYSSNQFSVNGIEVTLHAATGNQPSIVSTSLDADQIVETIKSFINDYNEVLKLLNDKVIEERYRKFPPLTDEQKKDMKEADIKLWEEKAKSGMLKGDPILRKAISELRSAMTTPIYLGPADATSEEKAKNSITLADIGIETGKWFEGGKLTLKNEAKLRETLEKNPEKLMAFFTNRPSGDNPPQEQVGVFNKMVDSLKGTLKDISDKAGTSRYSTDKGSTLKDQSILGKQIAELNKKIDQTNAKLKSIEDRYYRQFTAMEVALNKLNSQSGSLMSFMSK